MQRDLATLVAAELLYQRGQPPRALYRFKHALIQEAAYESVLRSVGAGTPISAFSRCWRRSFLRRWRTQPALLAHHALRGELWDQAVTYFRQAGEQAVARSAYREAVAAFEQALEAVQHLPESREHACRPLISAWRCAMRSTLWASSGGSSSTCRKPKPLPKPWATNIGWGGSRPIYSPNFVVAGELDRALASGQRALAIATALGDIGLTVTAQYYLGLGYYRHGGLSAGGRVLPKERGVSPRRAAP